MALSTVDVFIRPADGWVEVASNPTMLVIKPENHQPWWVAVTSGGAPASDLIGVPMGRGGDGLRESFQTGVISGKVFIKVAQRTTADAPNGGKVRFSVVKDV